MVVVAGYDICSGKLQLFNSVTNENNFLQLKPLGDDDDAKLIENFLKTVETKINEKIDYFCILMYFKHRNDFRKKIMEFLECQRNIKNVRIISPSLTLLYGAIENLSNIPETNDSLWIFNYKEDNIVLYLWNYAAEKRWKYQGGWRIEGNEKSFPTIQNLQNLKPKIKILNSNLPYIYVFHACILNESNFKEVFSEYKKIEFIESYDWSGLLFNYARYLLGEKKYMKLQNDIIFGRDLKIKTLKETIFTISGKQTLPLTKNVTKVFTENYILHVYENYVKTETIPLEIGNLSVTLFIDINGIYYIKIINLDKINVEEGKADFYFIPKKLSDYKSELNAIGIDFGTTECCAAVIRKNGPDFFVLDPTTKLRTMPSYIAFDEEKPKCGQIVIDRMRHKSMYTVYDSKRIIGKNFDDIVIDPLWPFQIVENSNSVCVKTETYLGQDTKSPEEISANLLQHIKTTTESYEGKKLNECVITIPSEFCDKQKQATKLAAEMAGWKIIHFLPEPVAAAFAYFNGIEIQSESNILIFDCGGGTVDICVAKIKTDKLKILDFDGDSFLGGRDFDKLLFNHFSAILKHKFGYDVMKSNKKFVLKQKCQEIKHKLSVANEDWLDVDDFDNNLDDIIKITSEEFEEMSSNFIVKMKDVILRSITKANVHKNAINYVFQVGGGCRMPMIKQLLLDIFPNANHQCLLDPDWVVAHGAALYAYHLKTRERNPKETQKTSWLNKMFRG